MKSINMKKDKLVSIVKGEGRGRMGNKRVPVSVLSKVRDVNDFVVFNKTSIRVRKDKNTKWIIN